MNEQFCKKGSDLLQLFEESVSTSDLLKAKVKAQIASAITKERIKLQMNQEEFAQHIGVRQSQVSRLEKGDYNFSIEKFR